jgi:hypothetical protein
VKKSLIVMSATAVILGILLTSCGKTNTVTDTDGKSHVIVTEKGGVTAQDPWGNLYEQVTDANGNTVTQAYDYPAVSTNKSGSKVENAVLSIKVPKEWEISENTTAIRLRHQKGPCVKDGEPACQLDFTYRSDFSRDEVCALYAAEVKDLKSYNSNVTNDTEYDTTILGIAAKALSYHVDGADTTVYYFCIEKGESIIEITANVYDNCYDSKSIEELINSCCTLKELPTLASTIATTLPTDEDTSTNVDASSAD